MVFFRDGEAVPGCISTSSRSAAKAMHHTPAGTPPSLEFLSVFSLKHDLARSCFQLWPKIGNEVRAIIENIIVPDYVVCYIPRAMAILI